MNDCDGPQFTHDALDTLFNQCVIIRALSWSEEVLSSTAPSKSVYQLKQVIAAVTTLILHWDATTLNNLSLISTHCEHLTTLCFQWPNDNNFDGVTLPELVSGCPALLTLIAYCEDNPDDGTLARNVILWGNVRQQLVVWTDFANAEKYRFNVMKMID